MLFNNNSLNIGGHLNLDQMKEILHSCVYACIYLYACVCERTCVCVRVHTASLYLHKFYHTYILETHAEANIPYSNLTSLSKKLVTTYYHTVANSGWQ